MTDVVLADGERDALVTMVVRGMARGEVSPEQQALADAGLILIKGPMMMPTPAGTALVSERLRLPVVLFAEGGGGKNRNQHVGLQMKWKNGMENDKESHPALNFEHSQETGNPLLCSVYRIAPAGRHRNSSGGAA